MNHGKIVFKINELLVQKSMSKNQLEDKSKLQRTQLNSYANNKVKRIDLDVLARLCDALDVEIEDILEYKKEK